MNVGRRQSAAKATGRGALFDVPIDFARLDYRHILGSRVDATSYTAAELLIGKLVASNRGGYICVASVHSIMEAHDHPRFNAILNAADLVTPDGVPLVWGLRTLGIPAATRVYGPDLTDRLCRWAADNDVAVGFHGSTDHVLDRLISNLTRRYPALRVAYRHSPPFRDLSMDECRREIESIRASGARLLFVGLGCPKQEQWMAERVRELDTVLVGVGAAFDYLAGTAQRPPRIVQQVGLEWLFRLCLNPRRLWRRYLRNNPRFLVLFAHQLIQSRTFGERA